MFFNWGASVLSAHIPRGIPHGDCISFDGGRVKKVMGWGEGVASHAPHAPSIMEMNAMIIHFYLQHTQMTKNNISTSGGLSLIIYEK